MFKFSFGENGNNPVDHSNITNCSGTTDDVNNNNGSKKKGVDEEAYNKPAKLISIDDSKLQQTDNNNTYDLVKISISEDANDNEDEIEIEINKSQAIVPCHLSPDHADIKPRDYEGGYKLWEGCIDLCKYIYKHKEEIFIKDNMNMLELGAGHAFPTIVSLKYNASNIKQCVLHDYNEDVIHDISSKNIYLNNLSKTNSTIKYYSGSWSSLIQSLLLPHHQFDLILTSETTYQLASIQSLAECILKSLANHGVAYVAGKSYYFGVGGSMNNFQSTILNLSKQLKLPVHIDKVDDIRDGSSNVREIVRIKRL